VRLQRQGSKVDGRGQCAGLDRRERKLHIPIGKIQRKERATDVAKRVAASRFAGRYDWYSKKVR
jgi:hypothetical protein